MHPIKSMGYAGEARNDHVLFWGRCAASYNAQRPLLRTIFRLCRIDHFLVRIHIDKADIHVGNILL